MFPVPTTTNPRRATMATMKFYRFTRDGRSPYCPSHWVTAGTTCDVDPLGRGFFAFDPSRLAQRFTTVLGWDEEHQDECIMDEEEVTLEFLCEQFGVKLFPFVDPIRKFRDKSDMSMFGRNLHVIEVDEDEVYSYGYGTYANMHSDNWGDVIEIPEVYIVLRENMEPEYDEKGNKWVY